MYYLHTTSINQTKDSSPKSDTDCLKAKEKLASFDAMGTHKRRHRDISTFDLRRQPWMKNFTLSSNDLIWGVCDPIEEQFMSISNMMMSASVPMNVERESPVIPASLSRSDNTPIPTNSRERHEQEYPRFRQDRIMDRDDVDLKMLELQTTTLRRSSSMSDDPPSASRRELLALCSRMMNQTDHGIADSWELECARDGRCEHVSDNHETGTNSVPKQNGTPSPVNTGGTQVHPSLHGTTYEHTINDLGSRVRIHDEERVYAAMKNGTATIIQCVGCSRHMLATRDIELVYCPGCGTITPIGIGCLPDDSPSCCESVARRQQREN